jgi:hypothetical protein
MFRQRVANHQLSIGHVVAGDCMLREVRVGNTNGVDAFMARLEHPMKAEIEAVRTMILRADPRIQESIKWNAPSFAVTEHFATFKLRPFDTVQVVFHTGAKVKPVTTVTEIDDPADLLKWAARDRGIVTFSSMREIKEREAALVSIVRQWIAYL